MHNDASQRVLERAGFEYYGMAREVPVHRRRLAGPPALPADPARQPALTRSRETRGPARRLSRAARYGILQARTIHSIAAGACRCHASRRTSRARYGGSCSRASAARAASTSRSSTRSPKACVAAAARRASTRSRGSAELREQCAGREAHLVPRDERLAGHRRGRGARRCWPTPPATATTSGPFMGQRGSTTDGDIGGLGFTDPPEHTRLRRLLTPEFTMRRLERLAPADRRDRRAASSTRSRPRPADDGVVDLVPDLRVPDPVPGDLRAARAARRGPRDVPAAGLRPVRRHPAAAPGVVRRGRRARASSSWRRPPSSASTRATG